MADAPSLAELETAPRGTHLPLPALLDQIRFDDRGLVPAIAQDATSGAVLMLAWMNRTAIERTLQEGYACYYSRSRQAYWRKGDTSGHVQRLVALRFDCDADAVLLRVEQTGSACHTMRASCFYLEVDGADVRVASDPA